MNISYFFAGNVRIFCDGDNITRLLNLCMYRDIPYVDFKSTPEGVELTLRLAVFYRFKREAERCNIAYKVVKRGGVPCFLARYRYRFGIYIGILLAAAMVYASRSFVWRIDVTGNQTVTTSEIKAILAEYGFAVGTYIPSVNTDKIENRIPLDSDTISWVSVNIIGNTAGVQIRERHKANLQESEKYANVIAKKSGTVQEVMVESGRVVANSGKFVNAGDLLISGIYDSSILGFRCTRASGKIMARTVSEYYVEIPFEYEEKRYTGGEFYDKYLNFFDYSINISKNYGKEGTLYDKIYTVDNCILPGETSTPFEIYTVKYLEYETVSLRRSAEEAENLAYFALAQKMSDISTDAVILKKTVTPFVSDDAYVIYCTVVAIEDIALVSEFDVQ